MNAPTTWDRNSREAVSSILEREEIILTDLVQAASVDADAAFLSGSAYYYGVNGALIDNEAAFRLYRSACTGGSMNGCNSLGLMYDTGEAGAEDDLSANEYYRLACDGGNMHGCANLGLQYATGEGVAKEDDSEANRYYQMACKGGRVRGCGLLGFHMYLGRGTTPDRVAGAHWLSVACENADQWACEKMLDLADQSYEE